MSPHQPVTVADAPDIETMFSSLISECRDPSRLIELFYWSTEPDLLPIVRAFVGLPPAAQTQIRTFLQATPPDRVHAEIDAEGNLKLSAADHAARRALLKTRRPRRGEKKLAGRVAA